MYILVEYPEALWVWTTAIHRKTTIPERLPRSSHGWTLRPMVGEVDGFATTLALNQQIELGIEVLTHAEYEQTKDDEVVCYLDYLEFYGS
jgi:hypothetical protein